MAQDDIIQMMAARMIEVGSGSDSVDNHSNPCSNILVNPDGAAKMGIAGNKNGKGKGDVVVVRESKM